MMNHEKTYKEILAFLWKWKVSTTAALSARFFANLVPHSAYKRLRYLEKLGLIQSGNERYLRKVTWTLTADGFKSIVHYLPALKEQGYKSEYIHHDSIVSAIHIGDVLINPNTGLQLLSEQQLRRYHADSLPDWAPKSKLHRPDGYWFRPNERAEPLLVALEVELSTKVSDAYQSIARFYARNQNIGHIVWVCDNKSFAKRLLENLKAGEPLAGKTHSVFILCDIEAHGWAATAKIGAQNGKSLRDLLGCEPILRPEENLGKSVGNWWEAFPVSLLLDFHKSQTNFVHYAAWLKSRKLQQYTHK
ncbi:MAG: hypothetical protein NT027_07400 [Proteobacteria bacterium]|nr:hypothetical protein [Pseudomonadota bacterium]